MSLFLFLPLGMVGAATYTLGRGETLLMVSRKFSIPVEAIRVCNDIVDVNRIPAGKLVKLPDPYQVVQGDTLYSLAKARGTSPQILVKMNQLQPNILPMGMKLWLPPLHHQENLQEKKPVEPPVSVTQSTIEFTRPFQGSFTTARIPVPALVYKTAGEFSAARDGVITYLGFYRELGEMLLLDTGKGLIFGYSGYESARVRIGQVVKSGDTLGVSSGTPPHFQFFAYRNGESLTLEELQR